MGITLAAGVKPVVALLAKTLLAACDSVAIQSTAPFPVGGHDYDFSHDGAVTINAAPSGVVSFTFARGGTVLSGTLNLTKLEETLVSFLPPPNYINATSAVNLGPAASISYTSPPISKVRNGVVYVDAELNVPAQSLQAGVTFTLYRDFGTPSQVQLGATDGPLTPGGITGYGVKGHPTAIDVLPDSAPHTYTVVATGSAGSQLQSPAGQANFQIFEIGSAG